MEHQDKPDEPGNRVRGRRVAQVPEDQPYDFAHRNEVLLVGRISSPLRKHELPSGDVVGMLRVVIDRGGHPRGGRRSNGFDAIDCASWSPKAHRKLEKWIVGDVIEVTGWLRRRFFRGQNGPASRYEVEINQIRLLAPAAKTPAKPQKAATAAKPRAA